MQRRNFLKTAAAGAALSATGPYFLGAADKAGSKTPVVGTGEHKYECVHNWGELPADFKWETTHGVCVDAAGHVYITHQGHGGKTPLDIVLVFDPAGKFVRSFGKDFFPGGHGIDVRKEGSEEFLYFSNVTRPVCTHSTTKMLPSLSKQASCGWTNLPGCHCFSSARTLKPSSTF